MIDVVHLDDREQDRDLVNTILNRDGISVIGTSYALEAAHLVVEHRPEVILSDIMMPGVDGYTFVSLIRAHPVFCNTKVLFLTAFLLELAHIERAVALGITADDIISKLEISTRLTPILQRYIHGA